MATSSGKPDERASQVGAGSNQKPAYYEATIPSRKFTPEIRTFIQEYCQLNPNEIEPHLYEMRDKAFQKFPYPCIGLWSFLDTYIDKLEIYPDTVERLRSKENSFVLDSESIPKESPKIIDVGCGLGQELRRLIHDGVPAGQLTATDIEPGFWDISGDLWRDGSALANVVEFTSGDITSSPSRLESWHGRFDFVYSALVFHLFSYANTITAASEIARLTKRPGSEIVIWQLGGTGSEVRFEMGDGEKKKEYVFFLADEVSFERVWNMEVPKQTGMHFQIVGTWKKPLSYSQEDWPKWLPKSGCMFEGLVRRIK